MSLLLTACASSPLIKSAQQGDRSALARQIADAEKQGKLSNSDAAHIAKAVAEREIAAAKGVSGADLLQSLSGCEEDVDGALADKMRGVDEAAAEAALLRLNASNLGEGSARDHATDAMDEWRAVGVRALTRTKDRAARQRAMSDGSPLVRRQAMRASAEANDPADIDTVLEAARLDPDPFVRTDAVRLIAKLPVDGRADLANKLRDLWVHADDAVREDIALAWSVPGIFEHGGREALRAVIAESVGPGAVEASAAIARDFQHRDADSIGLAVAHLVRTIESAPRRERLQAIAVVPIVASCAPGKGCNDPANELLAAVRRAATSDDAEVRVAAFSRLTEVPSERERAIRELEAYAKPGSAVAPLARAASAQAKNVRVQAWIEQDLTSADGFARLSAASELSALGRPARAAPLLVDADAKVRMRAACTIVLGARIH